MLPVLRKGDKGSAVEAWQNFLIGQGYDPKGADGDFGPGTEAATKAFQKKNKLTDDGLVGNGTYGAAAKLGFGVTTDPSTKKVSANWPVAPTDFSPTNGAKRDAEFGKFDFVHKPEPDNYENIEIKGSWESDNIISVEVPELAVALGLAKKKVRIHRKIEKQFLGLWAAWGKAGFVDRVITWEGAFNARFIRGGATTANVKNKNRNALSNHAWGTAFDINYKWNQLGKVPALLGEKGCVRELVAIANKFGFYWGGHFKSRPDGMHFEWGKWV